MRSITTFCISFFISTFLNCEGRLHVEGCSHSSASFIFLMRLTLRLYDGKASVFYDANVPSNNRTAEVEVHYYVVCIMTS